MNKALTGLGRLVAMLWRACAASARLFPTFVKKPGAVLTLFTRSHRAHLVLLAALLLAPSVLPSASNWLMSKLYRPVDVSILGLIETSRKHPKLETRQRQARYFVRYGCGVAVLLAFWCSIPSAVRRSDRIATLKKGGADTLAGDSPEESLKLYRSARRYAVDEALSREILEALVKVSGSISPVAAPATGEGTVVIEASGTGAVAQPSFSERYRTVRELGRGSMGLVFLARDETLERDVAVKRLPAMVSDAELGARLKKEALALARLNHPGIVQVYDFVETGEVSWLVMEYIPGEDLDELLKRQGPLEVVRAVEVARGAAEAIGYAHGAGVLHRDLKPANLMVGEGGAVKVTDFGVARLARSSAESTQLGTVLGSPSYMSPEQARGEELDERSDLYSFGATLYKLLSGEPPFSGTCAEVVKSLLDETPVPLAKVRPELPAELCELVDRLLAKTPAGRPGSMEEVTRRLGEINSAIS